MTDQKVRAMVRGELSPEVFSNNPLRALLVLPLIALVVTLSAVVVALRPPWYVALVCSVVLGNLYASLTFFAHEVCHGSTVRSQWLKTLIAYPCFSIFLLSPRLWMVWHNHVHHPQANIEGRDPDNFGTMNEYRRNTPLEQSFVRLGPGAGRWLTSLFFLCTFFTLQGQAVLWLKSRRIPGFKALRRTIAGLDSLVMLCFWVIVGVFLGWHDALLIIVLPMFVGNFVVMSYVSTNHMISPLSDAPNTLKTTLGVSTSRPVDALHLWFSHHVEHHLFPSMQSHHYPKVRKVLRGLLPAEDFQTPPHWCALLALVRTGRVYDGSEALVDPYTGQRTTTASIKAVLQQAGPLVSTSEDMKALLAIREDRT